MLRNVDRNQPCNAASRFPAQPSVMVQLRMGEPPSVWKFHRWVEKACGLLKLNIFKLCKIRTNCKHYSNSIDMQVRWVGGINIQSHPQISDIHHGRSGVLLHGLRFPRNYSLGALRLMKDVPEHLQSLQAVTKRRTLMKLINITHIISKL